MIKGVGWWKGTLSLIGRGDNKMRRVHFRGLQGKLGELNSISQARDFIYFIQNRI